MAISSESWSGSGLQKRSRFDIFINSQALHLLYGSVASPTRVFGSLVLGQLFLLHFWLGGVGFLFGILPFGIRSKFVLNRSEKVD